MNHTIHARVGLACALAALTAAPLAAQTRSGFVLAGYGTATYEASATNAFPNDFTASLSPVLLYSMGEDILFEAELEFGLSGAATSTTLEYAQIDYLGFENLQIIAGKFLLPFGVFGERLHPTWINKLPTGPVLFGHAHGGIAEAGLLPILSDAGAMVRVNQSLSKRWSLDVSGYVTQGPRLAEVEPAVEGDDGHAHFEAAAVTDANEEPTGSPAPPVAFGTSFSDNNKNKMLGARVGFVRGPSFEFYASGFHAMYDEENYLDYTGGALSLEWRSRGFELRAEGVVTRQEYQEADRFETLQRGGLYAQVSRAFGKWEPVVRYGRLTPGTVDGEDVTEGHDELALGLNLWVQPTVPLKLAWELHEGRDDRLYLQWAFGF